MPFNELSRSNLYAGFNFWLLLQPMIHMIKIICCIWYRSSIYGPCMTVSLNLDLFNITQAASVCEPNFPRRNGVTCWDRKLLKSLIIIDKGTGFRNFRVSVRLSSLLRYWKFKPCVDRGLIGNRIIRYSDNLSE